MSTIKADDTAADARKDEARLLTEIAVSGVFYGLGGLSERLFAWLEQQDLQAEQLVGLGRALAAMGRGDNGDALLMMERLCERYPAQEELLAVQALAAKRAGHGGRADKILAGLSPGSSVAQSLCLAVRGQ